MIGSTRWLARFFRFFGSLAPKVKKIFVWKTNPKIQNCQFFLSKNNMMSISYQSSNSVKKIKVDSSFLTPKWSVFVSEIIPIYDVTFQTQLL